MLSNDSAVAEGSEDACTELKPSLEAQTESIVYTIQSVLSGVRSPTPSPMPSPTVNENLTQIITIVSSIVAVCHDNLPPASAQQGNDILRELSNHANKLSEVQAMHDTPTMQPRTGLTPRGSIFDVEFGSHSHPYPHLYAHAHLSICLLVVHLEVTLVVGLPLTAHLASPVPLSNNCSNAKFFRLLSTSASSQ